MNGHLRSFCISGAGPVGLALALGLGKNGFRVRLVDHKEGIDADILTSDRRMLALSHRTVQFFKKLDVWNDMIMYATPINAVHVSQKKCKAEVLLRAKKYDVDHFGFLVPQGGVILALYEHVKAQENISLTFNSHIVPTLGLRSGEITYVQGHEKRVESFDWLVAAEGVHSVLRQTFGIETFYRDYDQVAVIARIKFEKRHNNVAYERFTVEGPLALLPINDQEMAAVLVVDRQERQRWERASKVSYSAEVLSRMGARLGDVTEVSDLQVWPLTLMVPKKVTAGKLLLAGNSAHGLHPIAGQGLNLGIRDCEAMIQLFSTHGDPSSDDLSKFNQMREQDIMKTVGATDFLVNAFGLQGAFAQVARSFGLLGVRVLPFVQKKIVTMGMGYEEL